MLETLGKLTHTATAGKVPGITDVVIEDFVLRERTKDRSLLSPVRITFGLEHELWMSPDNFFTTKQQPSDAKSTVTDDRLKRWGMWTVGQQHARDATRHLILFLRKVCQDQEM
jgi:hypothetical protein